MASIRNENARSGLGILLKILRGDKETIADISESWQEYVASVAFFSRPFALSNHKDIQHLYEDARKYGFDIDNTLFSEVAASALFTGDLPKVGTSLPKLTPSGSCKLFQNRYSTCGPRFRSSFQVWCIR